MWTFGNKGGTRMALHGHHKKKAKKEPGTGLKVTKRQKDNFKKFQEGFKSKLGILKK